MTTEREQLVAHACEAIRKGSKSFAAASRLFDRTTRERTWLLYAWCRRCDDLADAQDHGGALGDQAGAAERLAIIRRLTARALAGEHTGDPAFDGFAMVARECRIAPRLADDVIGGFALDVAGWHPHSEADLMRYCYHVAGAVGVMMALVMGVPLEDEDTLDRACDLGLAFQLANIARDVAEDAAAGRCYIPAEWLAAAGIAPGELLEPHGQASLVPLVARLCALQNSYEVAARSGAARLPFRSRWAVLSAAGIYGAIARKVERAGAQAWDHRIATTKAEKAGHLLRAGWQSVRNTAPSAPPPPFTRRVLATLARKNAAR